VLKTDNVIAPNSTLRVEDLGMPVRGQIDTFGDLYVNFDVDFPDKTTDQQKKKLLEVFEKAKFEPKKGAETHELKKFTEADKKQNARRTNGDAMDEDEGGGGNVQCTQQ